MQRLMRAVYRTLAHTSSKHVDDMQNTWDEVLQFVIFAASTSEHDTTGESPFKPLYSREPTLPLEIALPTLRVPFLQDIEKRT